MQSLRSTTVRPLRCAFAASPGIQTGPSHRQPQFSTSPTPQFRAFTSSPAHLSWLAPNSGDWGCAFKGRPRVPIGGSTRGTTIVWGDYGVRMTDHHRRLSALQLKNAEDTIRRKLRGMKYRLYMRVSANIPVYTKGNETRMGTGKGTMDYWACRVPVSRIIFELKGEVHEQLVREAFKVACAKMPGKYEFVRKGDPPMMGITKLTPENVRKLASKKVLGGFPKGKLALAGDLPTPMA